jgi:hypothetical protein
MALLYDNNQLAEEIKYSRAPWDALKLGKRLPKDQEISENTLFEVVCVKAQQCPNFTRYLKQTGSDILIENTRDPFWGAGPDKRGRNTFGKMLMYLRNILLDPNDSELKNRILSSLNSTSREGSSPDENSKMSTMIESQIRKQKMSQSASKFQGRQVPSRIVNPCPSPFPDTCTPSGTVSQPVVTLPMTEPQPKVTSPDSQIPSGMMSQTMNSSPITQNPSGMIPQSVTSHPSTQVPSGMMLQPASTEKHASTGMMPQSMIITPGTQVSSGMEPQPCPTTPLGTQVHPQGQLWSPFQTYPYSHSPANFMWQNPYHYPAWSNPTPPWASSPWANNRTPMVYG